MEEPKRNEWVLIVGILLFVLIVGFLLIVLYSTKNKNQVKIYSVVRVKIFIIIMLCLFHLI